jgi:DNA-binding PadR family transcriptional regulator
MQDRPLSKPAYTILGMLQLGPTTGYEIKSLVDISTRFFWAASYGQIYPELNRLEELGLIRGERDEASGRRRKAYQLTEEGERALHEWLASKAPLHFELRHEGVLKLFFADALDHEGRRELLRTIRAEHERVRDELRAIEPIATEKRTEQGLEMPLAVLRWDIAYQDFMVDSLARMESEIG